MSFIEEVKNKLQELSGAIETVLSTPTPVQPEFSDVDLAFLKDVKDKLEAKSTELKLRREALELLVEKSNDALDATQEVEDAVDDLLYEIDQVL